MKKIFFFIVLIISGKLTAQCVYEWGITDSPQLEVAVCKDRAGNIITVSNTSQGYIKKCNSAGVQLFNVAYSASSTFITYDCATDNNNNIYVTGSYKGYFHVGSVVLNEVNSLCSQVFVLKLSPTGTLLWLKGSTGNPGGWSGYGDDVGFEVTADNAGNCYLAGMFSNNFIFGTYDLTGNPKNNFMSKLDGATGNVLWIKTYNDYGNVLYAPKTKACKNGDFFQVANYHTTVHVDSTTTYPPSINGYCNVYVAMYNTNGNLKWSIVSSGQGCIQSVTMDSHENIIITGIITDSIGFGTRKIYSPLEKSVYFAKIDTLGNVLQLERIVSCTDITADIRTGKYGIDTDSLDNVYLSGRLTKDVNFNGLTTTQVSSDGHRSFVVKYDNMLTPLWYNTFDVSTNTNGFNVGVLKIEHKNVFATGYFYNDIVIDSVSFNYSTNSFYEYIAEMCDQNGNFEVPAGIEENKFPETKIFPNPANTYLNIENISGVKYKLYEIYNSSGQLMSVQKGGANKIDLESIQYNNGLYLLKISLDDGRSKKIKFVIDK